MGREGENSANPAVVCLFCGQLFSFLVAPKKSQLSASLVAMLITRLLLHAEGELSYSSAKETNPTARISKYGLQFAIVLLDQG